MCKIYNQVGSLTAIKNHLQNHKINDFHSVNEILTFQKNYLDTRQQLVSSSTALIKQEKEKLTEELLLLEDFIETCKIENTKYLQLELIQLKQQFANLTNINSNFFDKITSYFQKNNLQGKIRFIENNFEFKIADSLRQHTDLLLKKKYRHQYIDNNFEKAVQENIYTQLRDLERKKQIVDELTSTIYGAIGEQKVSKELELLSDDYILINDFSCTFHPPIYNRKDSDYIKSVQIDQILISPAGVFLIETKNWSEESMKNLSLRSPVEQIKRTSFALYQTLNGENSIFLSQHHWGERKIPIKNLIVMIKQKPKEEFQYVKIVTLKELNHYVSYFPPIFTKMETLSIANYLLKLSGNTNY
ncbi:MAG TPA: nuclease-related domain-containing protein [Saprospiraceae bacterium]|nr:nuclease-related domain-containing protein [Saprospiraceae bacterium]